jgi:hypothetical protein
VTISEPEGTSTSTVVYTAATQGAGITYSLTGGDASSFTIDFGGKVKFVSVPDFETKVTYNFTIDAIKAGSLFSTETVVVNITDLPPVISSGTSGSITEGVAAGTIVYTAVANDPAGGTVTYSLSGTDASSFSINASTGVVTINSIPNYETKSSYSFNVVASDPSLLSSSSGVTVNVIDVAPTITSGSSGSITEGSSAGTVVYTATATDPAGGTLTYSLSGTDASSFTINASTGVVTINSIPNYETKSSYSFNVVASDSTLANSKAVTIFVTDVAPTITSGPSGSITEGSSAGTVVYTATATDPAGGTLTYSLSGTDASSFTINASTGIVTINSIPNYETKSSYSFNVVASDSTLTSSKAVTIFVTDVAPTITSGSSGSIVEGVPAGTVVYTATATDPAGGTLTYSLSGTDASSFTINASTGVVTINSIPDYETKSSYSFNVLASDSTLTSSQGVIISVIDVAPTITSASSAFINEGVPAGSVVYNATATDPAGGTVAYSLIGTDASYFTLNASTGAVMINSVPDFETKSSYSFNVLASDPSGAFNLQSVVITVNDLPPVFTSGSTTLINDRVSAGTAVYTAVAADPAGGAVTYSLSGPDAAAFSINPLTGTVTINSAADYDVQSTFHFVVSAADSSLAVSALAVTATVQPLVASGPFELTGVSQSNGVFGFTFTNLVSVHFTALATTNPALPLSDWTVLGSVTDNPPGEYHFTDPAATNYAQRFYLMRSP